MVSAALAGPAGTSLTHWGPWGGPGPGGGFGWLFLLIPLFWIGLFVLIFTLAARRRRRFWAANGGAPGWGAGGGGRGGHGWGPGWAGAGAAGTTSDAEKTLAERFARGDIDEVEYRARLEVLQSGRPAPSAGPVPPTKS
ncbi:hypothetical protein B7R22_09590 [Subtercola boreus]|uniref:SHOCT domain-containing protein n=1 Tax=Subtercola boreus TaxID=120213 RepID=A0A3E0VYH0_9MICO|nr:hypothetical protein B7R22_09590 [Subtercola boreus]